MANEEQTMSDSQPIRRADGVTSAERYLQSLCEKSFLTLWSYAGVYRDEGKTGAASHGKEVCDLLVIFENHIIIFSDKDCNFPDTGDLQVDWNRWFRKAVVKSADQVWGAEKWIRTNPGRLFIDRACTQRLPVEIPDPSTAVFHRIVVAHASSIRCREELHGSGSLTIVPDVISDGTGTPFVVGQVNPSKGFIHILDDISLSIVLETLNTVTDFVNYLTRKEQFISSGRLLLSQGEEELLATYLKAVDANDQHTFPSAKPGETITIHSGLWKLFVDSPERKSQLEADKVSHAWDGLIEEFNENILANTLYPTASPGIANYEKAIRFLAREPRLRRRMLAKAILGLIRETPKDRRAVRGMAPTYPGDPYFIFLFFPRSLATRIGKTYEEYRHGRAHLLEAYCYALKASDPNAEHIVGIVTEPADAEGRSEDVVYFDFTNWTSQDQEYAEKIREEYGLFNQMRVYAGTEWEFPVNAPSPVNVVSAPLAHNPRNKTCPCGSGKKYKHCHGR
jgi:hypothetical protein